jgi:hypothetical protein
MAYTVTCETEADDGTPIEPIFHVNRGHELHHGLVDDDSDYYEDQFGNLHHKYADLDPQRVHDLEDQLDGEADYEASDADALMDIVGGNESYSAMTQWASRHLSDDAIAEFDAVIDSGNLNAMEEAIIWLAEQYQMNGGYEDDAEVFDDSESEIHEAVLEAYPNYNEMTSWAEDNIDPESIAQFNQVMDSGDADEIAECVDWLARQFYS